jgi:serine/threonine-protein phosphatase 2A regulatory subunit B
LFCSDKTVKLWKVYEKPHYMPSARESVASGGGLCMPRMVNKGETVSQSYQRRAFMNAHAYNINSISLNCDGESFVSADDLRINLWNLEHSDRCMSKCCMLCGGCV